MDSDWKKVVREAARQGWTVEFGRRGQLKLIPPDPASKIVIIHRSPSDHRALKNAIAEMRRQGLQWPPKRKGQSMTEWSVAVTTPGPGPGSPDRAAAEIGAKLADLAPVVAVSPTGVTVRIAVEASLPEDAVAAAITAARCALESVGWPSDVVEVEAVEWTTFERKLGEPTHPELVGITEIAELLGTSRQRASELARSSKFPAPLADLAAGPVWPKPAVARFVEEWERKPGRPRSTSAGGP